MIKLNQTGVPGEKGRRNSQMENVINKLSEIETIASKIMEAVIARKKEIARQKEAEKKAFDARLEEETGRKLAEIRQKLEDGKSAEIMKLQENVEKVMERMETDFDARQDEMADEICAKILGM
ncbi:hypothetical protein MUB23_17620 [Cuneatibacter sp. NSJ-177]|uniref:hypothetical protein n=1 Tax=Cuneatibacter sp. NSJ-177 TaxID=2931401 RepID=UPI001FD59A31|nr:hypothetical protein [Cuneatibacter sp. NSJ-177]MCJ7837197.1 hypothetical protein [Cuneatibacter sp. NSJ-177]